MKKVIIFIAFCCSYSFGHAQELTDPTLFDFWVGKWDLTWDDGDGITGKGTNNIVRILDGKVIQENFHALEGKLSGFKGTSITVFKARFKTWKQSWADNKGGHLEFTGDLDGDKRIFKTQPREVNGKTIFQRMVFHDIKEDSLTWDWESTPDGGETWKLLWRISYKRAD